MNEEDRKKLIGFSAAVIAILIFLWYFRNRQVQQAVAEPASNGFADPYTQWPNGIYPGGGNMNGQNDPFNSINVTVNVPQFGQLTQDYIPTFGFVGVTALGS